MKHKKNISFLALLSLLLATHNSYSKLPVYQNKPMYNHLGYDNCNMKTNGEQLVLSQYINDSDCVFDVGAHKGEWSQHVYTQHKKTTIYAFEPIPKLFWNLQQKTEKHNVHTYQYALSNTQETKDFVYYPTVPGMSSLYERPEIIAKQNLEPEYFTVQATTIDLFCNKHSIDHINFIKIDTEGSELDVLHGAHAMLYNKKIDYIQFEYGGTYTDAHITLRNVFDYFQEHCYSIYRIIPGGLVEITTWDNALENYRYSNYLATAMPLTKQNSLQEFFEKTLTKETLVFDIGAHCGQKACEYEIYGGKTICVEPQPACIKKLTKLAEKHNFTIEPYAVASKKGTIELEICSQAPTISTCAHHWQSGRFSHYTWDKKISVPTTTLDALIEKHGIPVFCKIDVEGFELDVLYGLSQKIGGISFEWTHEFADQVIACLEHLTNIGYTEFSITHGEHPIFIFNEPQSAETVIDWIYANPDQNAWGDIYAFE